MNTQGIQKVAQTMGGAIAKNSPTILTGLSVAGLIATTVMAVKATPKAIQLLEEKQLKEYKDPMTKKEIIKETWRCYAPAAAMGLVTVGCIVGANSINLRRNAALASVYSISEAALKEYQAKVVETIGRDREKAIKDEIKQEKLVRNPVSKNEVIITGKGDTLCYDAQTGRYFKSDMETIKSVMNSLSRRLMSDMFISLNDVYSELGLEGTKLGDLVGWHVDNGLIDPDFGTQLAEDGRPCLVLDFEVEPKYYDREY